MKPQPEVATSTCSSTRPIYASLLSVLFTFVDNSRKHPPNLRTGLGRAASTSPLIALPMRRWRCPPTKPPFKTHSSR